MNPIEGLTHRVRRRTLDLILAVTVVVPGTAAMGADPSETGSGYSLGETPSGLAAWMLDHDPHSYEQIAHAFEGRPVGELTRDEILDDITLYWVTNTGASAARLHGENASGASNADALVPAAFTVFPGELWRAPRTWVERSFPHLIYFHEVDKGGHFAAWEQPRLFAEEVRAAFRWLR